MSTKFKNIKTKQNLSAILYVDIIECIDKYGGSYEIADLGNVLELIQRHLNSSSAPSTDVIIDSQMPNPFELVADSWDVVGELGGGYIHIAYLENGDMYIFINRPDLDINPDPEQDD